MQLSPLSFRLESNRTIQRVGCVVIQLIVFHDSGNRQPRLSRLVKFRGTLHSCSQAEKILLDL